ncbi:hypothetical protein C8R47DRAFT_1218366 [Mycena vitilis]|nr:hypothetical protein C8R47DRAFT_1218366 [Mycena vitilis]
MEPRVLRAALVNEGAGAVYVCGRVLTSILDDFREEHIDRATFLANLGVKYGFAVDLEKWRLAYLECEEGHWTHLWFWAFYTDYRVVAERVNHPSCSWQKERPGSFASATGVTARTVNSGAMRMSTQGELALAASGDANTYREDLEDIDIAFPPA